MTEETVFEAENAMDGAVVQAEEALDKVPSVRVTTKMFASVKVEASGVPTPLAQMVTITVPTPRLAILVPLEHSSLGSIENALRASGLDVEITNDGSIIRVALRTLTDERRRELTTLLEATAEEHRTLVRGIESKAKLVLDQLVADGEASAEEATHAHKDLEGTTQQRIAALDALLGHRKAALT
ncbi:ribosome-recycling factor [Streptomyces sp. NPDC005227]|uniref:ribosome-recycling factor n=1 Tax=Streptomyces sp. NPDC005227 TaxID=3364707 RepID=UPI0036C496C4